MSAPLGRSGWDSVRVAWELRKMADDIDGNLTRDVGSPKPFELTFATLREVNGARARKWHPGFPGNEPWSLADWSNALAGEVGEACNVVKKIRRHETGIRGLSGGERHELDEALADELADVALYLDLVAQKAGINLAAAIALKFNRTSVEYGFTQQLPIEGTTEGAS